MTNDGHPSSPATDITGSTVNRRRMLTIALGGAATVALPAPAWAADDKRPGRPGSRRSRRRPQGRRQVSAERALEHLRVLTEEIGPRIGGTALGAAAADYIARAARRLGYDVALQPFAVADKFLAQLASPAGLPRDTELAGRRVGPTPRWTPPSRVTWSTCGAGADIDYPADAAGKIVLVDYVAGRREQLVATAVARGAAAVIFLAADRVAPRRAATFNPTLPGSAGTPVPIPVVGVAQAQKDRLRALLAAGRLTLTVSTEAHRNLTSHNVIADAGAAGRRDRPGRHGQRPLRHVIGAPGANDDGSGTVLCLELARVLKDVPTDATLRFALWGSEEQGLIGSRYYVRNLPQAERDRIVAVYQNDMVATSWDPATRYWLLSFDRPANGATDEVADAGPPARLRAADLPGDPARVQRPPVLPGGRHRQRQLLLAGRDESPALLEPPYHTPGGHHRQEHQPRATPGVPRE